jgi:hypothetical protein
MIWDEIRKRLPVVRQPTWQVVRVPFPVSPYVPDGEAGSFKFPTNDEDFLSDRLVRLLPLKDGKVDGSWLRCPFEGLVIASTNDERGCLLVRIVADDGPEDLVQGLIVDLFVVIECGCASVANTCAIGITSSGTVVMSSGYEAILGALTERAERFGFHRDCVHDSESIGPDNLEAISGLIGIKALAVLGLLNCMNVERCVVQPRRQARRAAVRNGLPLVSWHELVVRGCGVGSQGDSPAGESLALHWVRGHFKDYRSGGLFGRQRGVYWWAPHLAGQADRVAMKDYRLQG